MPVQKSKSSMAAELGSRLVEAAAAHQHDEVELDNFGALPEGIENGIAQVNKCWFDKYKDGDMKGKYFFMAQASVVSPEFVDVLDPKTKEVRKIKVAGRFTKIGPEPMCDTPKRSRKTMEEHVAWVQNEMKKIGADPAALGADSLEDTAAAIASSKPYISFRTWKGKPTEAFPTPRVQETWSGQCEYDGSVDAGAQTEESSGATANHETNGAGTQHTEEAAVAGNTFNEFEDLATLVGRANADDTEAREKLQELAIANGATAKQVEAADSWEDVAKLASPTTANEEEAAEAPFEPTVGKMFKYQPLDPKTGK